MTAFGSIETAIRAVKEGAFDHISKPFDIETMIATVHRALATQSLEQSSIPDREAEDDALASGLIGCNPAMLEIYQMIARVSDSRAAARTFSLFGRKANDARTARSRQTSFSTSPTAKTSFGLNPACSARCPRTFNL